MVTSPKRMAVWIESAVLLRVNRSCKEPDGFSPRFLFSQVVTGKRRKRQMNSITITSPIDASIGLKIVRTLKDVVAVPRLDMT